MIATMHIPTEGVLTAMQLAVKWYVVYICRYMYNMYMVMSES